MTYCTIYYPKLPLQSKVTAEKVRLRKKDQIKIGHLYRVFTTMRVHVHIISCYRYK